MDYPSDGLVIDRDTVLEPGVYLLPQGISIAADNITLDGNGALLIGANRSGHGVTVLGRSGITIKNLRLQEYAHGIYAQDGTNLTIAACRVTATAEVPANTIFLDVWKDVDEAYGSGILLHRCSQARILDNDLQHQMIGLSSYHSGRLTVQGNNASYCSGYGFHLFDTSDSLYENNYADYCCRYQPRGERRGHMGADAAGFLIITRSCRNVFRRNWARLGGDGFFLAGLNPQYVPVPCNDNRFEENDASYSPNIAFEATFSAGNVFAGNLANFCNYGFWLGFSSNSVIEDNQVIGCHQAGIATEMGYNFLVRRNTFRDNHHGILLWSKHIPAFLPAVPGNHNSYAWTIEDNHFLHNDKAIRIAANQDHGIRPYAVPEGEDPARFCRPYNHILRGNTFRDNRVAVEALCTDGTIEEGNHYEGNLHPNVVHG